MDISTIAVPVLTWVLSIGTVSAFISKNVTKVIKYVRLSSDAINALEHLAEALEDGALNTTELDKLQADIVKFKADLKA